jgi:hypothetical protein
VDDSGKCSASIKAVRQNKNMTTIPCQDCPKPFEGVKELGGGWTWCGSPWPVVCRPIGIHHHHCSSKGIAGIFFQSFKLDNRATDDWPGNVARRVKLVIRVLKGYDEDFGQAMVVVWVEEMSKVVTTFVETQWATLATVVDDVVIADSYPIPSPQEYDFINLSIAILPINNNETSDDSNKKCRLYFQSVMGEFV